MSSNPTTSTYLPQFTVPLEEILSPQWAWPTPLNTTFVSKFNAQLPPSTFGMRWDNGSEIIIPPSVFGERGWRPDIIMDSLNNLTFDERREYPINKEYEGRYTQFGEQDVIVRVGDTITLDWIGGEERVVALTCHECLFPDDRETGKGIMEACGGCKSAVPHDNYKKIINAQPRR